MSVLIKAIVIIKAIITAINFFAMDNSLTNIYRLLYERFGPQNWWPGETKTEIIIGAVLTQNTSWKNVEKAIANLRSANHLCFKSLKKLSQPELAQLIRPAGYYNIKAKRLKNFVNWLFENYNGNLGLLDSIATDQLRQELLSINGVGMETADSILLYAFEREIFVVDAYTCRVLVRHGLMDMEFCDYQQVQQFLQHNLQSDVKLYNEFHALFVCVGKQFCKPTPKCEKCPLCKLPHQIETQY